MRLHRKGKLSSDTFYYDDTLMKHNKLPETINLLHPTYVYVSDIMVDIGFFSKEGMQTLGCDSNEFGQPVSSYEYGKGLGWRKDPFGMDTLYGKESLDYLNKEYEDFEMEMIPGLVYRKCKDEELTTLEEVKRSIEHMAMFMNWSQKAIAKLAVKKQRLLYKTNHHELLKACRQVIKRHNDGAFTTDKIYFGDGRFTEDHKLIPKIILNLEPVLLKVMMKRKVYS